ncbi:MAG TPA: hypothetical protein VF310_11405, partial [Vicinamibacteria bacterium]
LTLGVPFPCPLGQAQVRARAGGGAWQTFTVGPEIRTFSFRAPAPAAGPVLVELRAPTWNRVGEPAQQGVRVDRVTLTPAP